MEIPHLAFVVFDISVVLSIAAVSLMVTKRLKLAPPYPVLVFLIGLIFSLLPIDITTTLELDPELILFIFLPLLLFESAYNFDFNEFKWVFLPSSLLATVGLMIAFGIIAGVLILFGFDTTTALIFASVISSTDPIAVVSIFKSLGIPRRLLVLIDSESFMNDATSIILFRILLTILGISAAGSEVEGLTSLVGNTLLELVLILVSSTLVGLLIGWMYSEIVSLVKNNSAIEISLSLIAALLSFAVAEAIFDASGILAVLLCGLVIGNYGSSKISPRVKHNLSESFELGGYLSTAFVFYLIGYHLNTEAILATILVSLSVAMLVFAARAISVYSVMGFVNKFTSKKVPLNWLHVINLSGIRGALPIALVLSIPASVPQREDILQLTAFVVLTTLILNSYAVTMLLEVVQLNILQLKEKVQQILFRLVLLSKVKKKVNRMHLLYEIDQDEETELQKKLKERSKRIVEEIDEFYQEDKEDERVELIMEKELLKYGILIEHNAYFSLYSNNVISGHLYDKLTFSLQDQVQKITEGEDQIRERTEITKKIKKLKKGGFSLMRIAKQYLGYTEEESITSVLLYYKARVIGDEQVIEHLHDIDDMCSHQRLKNIIQGIIDQYKGLIEYNLEVVEHIKKKYPKTYKRCEDQICDIEFDDLTEHLKEELDAMHIFSDVAITTLSSPRLH